MSVHTWSQKIMKRGMNETSTPLSETVVSLQKTFTPSEPRGSPVESWLPPTSRHLSMGRKVVNSEETLRSLYNIIYYI